MRCELILLICEVIHLKINTNMSPKQLVKFRYRCLTMIGACRLFAVLSYAQTDDFITEIPVSEITKHDTLISYEQSIRRHGNVKNFTYIKVGSLAQAQKEGYLVLRIPGTDKVITAKGKSVKYFSEKDYEWIGKTDGDRGTVILSANRGLIQGHISTPMESSKFYQLLLTDCTHYRKLITRKLMMLGVWISR